MGKVQFGETIDHRRRRIIGAAAMTIAAAELGAAL